MQDFLGNKKLNKFILIKNQTNLDFPVENRLQWTSVEVEVEY